MDGPKGISSLQFPGFCSHADHGLLCDEMNGRYHPDRGPFVATEGVRYWLEKDEGNRVEREHRD